MRRWSNQGINHLAQGCLHCGHWDSKHLLDGDWTLPLGYPILIFFFILFITVACIYIYMSVISVFHTLGSKFHLAVLSLVSQSVFTRRFNPAPAISLINFGVLQLRGMWGAGNSAALSVWPPLCLCVSISASVCLLACPSAFMTSRLFLRIQVLPSFRHFSTKS